MRPLIFGSHPVDVCRRYAGLSIGCNNLQTVFNPNRKDNRLPPLAKSKPLGNQFSGEVSLLNNGRHIFNLIVPGCHLGGAIAQHRSPDKISWLHQEPIVNQFLDGRTQDKLLKNITQWFPINAA
jgi:hypothetical protein